MSHPLIPHIVHQGPPVQEADKVPWDISRKEKVAIVMSLLVQQGADFTLSQLPASLQRELTESIAQLRLVDRNALSNVVKEFAEELDAVGLSLGGGLALLEGKISKQTAEKLRKESGVRQFAGPWERLRRMSVEDLSAVVADEGIEVAAVLLSKLDIARAASILGALAGGHARKLNYVISMTENVTPDALDRIG